jgi:predicted nucleic acid-binding protein
MPVVAMSGTNAFFDTNVLLYEFSEDAAKASASENVIRGGGVISVQVLNEFANAGRRKLGLSWAIIRDILGEYRTNLTVVPVTLETHERGLELAERYQLNVYDGMIVAAALLAGCTTVYSEDLHNGLVIDRLTIRNPYTGDPGG